ncbi:MAG: amidohydrolase family protein [Frisingicoccus sp.]
MATINGARALMDEDLYGPLEVGKKADLIVINPDSAGMLPLHHPVANLVSSMHSSNVESTMCDGKWLMKDRIVLSLNEEEVLAAAKEHAAAIRSRAGIELPDRFPVVYPMSSK